uniref:Zf-BED domain-containing protein n=1 Tax=Tanacetum cinerariifolium TaxID=118510 RepID=A0A6L2MTV3_TANCI|nr:zf-BED domain-containing protein [Tanacetum cinerariifolium]
MTKVIKEECEKLRSLEINDDSLTCNTQLNTLCDEFNRLRRINNDLFTYDIKVPKPFQCDKHAMIFVNKRLAKLIDVTVEQWLDLKYGNHMTMNENIKKEVLSTWLIRNYKLQFKEYLEIKRQRDTYARDVDMEYDQSNLVRGDDEVELSDEESLDPDDENPIDENEVAEIFRIETNVFDFETPTKHLEWPTRSWKDDGYCNGGNLPRAYIVGNILRYQDLEWYKALKYDKLKEEVLKNKSIMERMINKEKESLDETWRKWDKCENTTDYHEESNVYNEEEHEGEQRRKDTTYDAAICKIKRFQMIKL